MFRGKKLLVILLLMSMFLLSLTAVLGADAVLYTDAQPTLVTEPSTGSCTELCAQDANCNCGQHACDGSCSQDPNQTCKHLEENALSSEPVDVVTITFFYSELCPHCHEALSFFGNLSLERSDFELVKYEVYYNESNRVFAQDFCEAQDVPFQSVPTFFVGDTYFVGYAPSMDAQIIEAIDVALAGDTQENNSSVKIPFIGEMDPTAISLPVLAVVLGFIDGFNPCAFFVLLFLLSMLVYAKSKKRMLLIGLTFVFFSALIYFIFMSAWLSFFLVTSSIGIITTIAGIVALIFAIINIKDFFAFKKGASLSISDSHRSNLIKKMRGLLKAESLASMMVGTIVLAVMANMYELLCTAGFPMVFTKTLTLHELPRLTSFLYLVLYNVAYIIPLLVIVLVFTFTLGSKKLSQKQGEMLKLLSGMMMLALGGMLVFAPSLLSNMFAAIGLILLALVLTGIIIMVKRFLEAKKSKKSDVTGLREIKKK